VIDGTGSVGYDLGAGGLALNDNTRKPRLFKIVSGSNPYTANEVILQESDGTKVTTGVYDVTAAQKLLWEVNGNTAVPVNTVVEATPNPAGLGFYFTWQGDESAYGSGSGDGPTALTVVTDICLSPGGDGGFVRKAIINPVTVEVIDEYCEPIPTCGSGENGGLCDDIPPPSGSGSGSGSGGVPACCSAYTYSSLTATLTGGHGTKTLTWDGVSWESAPFSLTCVSGTFVLKFSAGCELTWSDDGGETFYGITPVGTTVCGPPLSSTGWGFAPGGSCGTITVTVESP
jgi:hypothetical protein